MNESKAMSGDMLHETNNGLEKPGNPTEEKKIDFPKTYTGKSFKDVDHIINADGNYLFCKYWKPKTEIRALVFHIHGYAEHCGRYKEIAEKLTEIGVFSFSHDHVAHGESEVLRGYVSDYTLFLRDIWQHIDLIKLRYPNVPIFLYGHSMGGGLSIFLANERPNFFRGCLLSAPFIQFNPELATPLKIFMAKVVSRIAPKLRVGKIDPASLSRDQKAIDNYVNDPLNDCDGLRACFATQFLAMSDDIKKIMPNIICPLFVAHSEIDTLTSFAGSKLLIEVSQSKDKTFRTYKDALHMLEHELPEFVEKYFADVSQWIKDRM